VTAGVEQHLLEQQAVGRLDLDLFRELPVGLLDAVGEVVAQALELAEREQSRAAAPGYVEVDPGPREGGYEGCRQL
jgi:hypothetical protein